MFKLNKVDFSIYFWTFLVVFLQASHVCWSQETEAPKKSITCYDCNSEYDPNCGENFEPTTLGTVNCSLRSTPEHLNQSLSPVICRKLVMKVYGKVRVYRGCGYIESSYDDKECAKRSGTHDVHTYHCSCTTSLCNSANFIESSILLTIFAISMFRFT